jgi:hypothetical protein
MTRTLLAALALIVASPAVAGPCSYRPSELLRSGTEVATAPGVQETAGGLVQGFFTLTNTATGASLLGGTTATGALGQIGSAATAIGSGAATALAAPGAAIAGAAAALGIGAYEGLCYFTDDRITEYDAVLAVMNGIAASADPAFFYVEQGTPGEEAAIAFLGDGTGAATGYPVRNLYIVNGVLMHRDRGFNTALGDVGFAATQEE